MQKSHYETQNAGHHLNIILIAENIRTPENVGMMMRLSEAFGVREIFFAGEKAVDFTTKVKRASRNTYKTVQYTFNSDAEFELERLKKEGYRSIALEITEKSKSIHHFENSNVDRIAIIVGSERQGVSDKVLNLCEEHFHIPMYGQNSSINVVNALSIGFYKITESL
ncbi:TrmH family RNA methyltransferase [Marivirga arenosa]|uniref:TrmH family RNA methyltransferase n=1 Tax=Marivirga arenosa TaxID=3059076 RepID=A0AA49GEK2_9BACT|nr:TrmH family RNA methyltransferase [Marivirga sp. ABR2-2]WKK85941.2 TrmH family RNA methyltransferase [Marivirga sp. ABR2-2]